MNMEGLLDSDGAARLLGISRKSLYDYSLRVKGFPLPERVGRTVLWREDELRSWRKTHPSRKRE